MLSENATELEMLMNDEHCVIREIIEEEENIKMLFNELREIREKILIERKSVS